MENRFKLHPYYASLAIVLYISVAVVSLLPSEGIPKTEINHLDKIVHVMMYFVLSLVSIKGFKHKNETKRVCLPIILTFMYSINIEILQEMITNTRFFEIFDILANGIGCVLAFWLVKTPYFQINNNVK